MKKGSRHLDHDREYRTDVRPYGADAFLVFGNQHQLPVGEADHVLGDRVIHLEVIVVDGYQFYILDFRRIAVADANHLARIGRQAGLHGFRRPEIGRIDRHLEGTGQIGRWFIAFLFGAGLFILLLVSVFLTLAVEPGVNRLAARGWRRGTATISILLGVLISFLVFAGAVSGFIERHPTIKMLALAFLLMIGLMLVVEGFGKHIEKGYIYFAMGFSVFVEMLNLRIRGRNWDAKPVRLRQRIAPRRPSPMPQKMRMIDED